MRLLKRSNDEEIKTMTRLANDTRAFLKKRSAGCGDCVKVALLTNENSDWIYKLARCAGRCGNAALNGEVPSYTELECAPLLMTDRQTMCSD